MNTARKITAGDRVIAERGGLIGTVLSVHRDEFGPFACVAWGDGFCENISLGGLGRVA
jgi:preprotein translocase subunit YajC